MSDWINVTKIGEIAEGGHRVVDVDGAHVASCKMPRAGGTDTLDTEL